MGVVDYTARAAIHVIRSQIDQSNTIQQGPVVEIVESGRLFGSSSAINVSTCLQSFFSQIITAIHVQNGSLSFVFHVTIAVFMCFSLQNNG